MINMFIAKRNFVPKLKVKPGGFARYLSLLRNKAYVNGKWVDGSRNEKFDVRNPATGALIESVPSLDVDDVRLAIESAAKAFEDWKITTSKHRSYILRKWYDLCVENAEGIADIVTAEAGKPKAESIGEVTYGNSFIEWFSEEARRIKGEVVEGTSRSKEMIFLKQPIGVTGLITPWNFPIAMITRKACAALAAGCTCVVKPAEDTPLTALALAELADRAGIPAGAFNVVTCNRTKAPAVGQLMCTHPEVAGISFTGSTAVGKILYSHCAKGVKRIALELGGNAPFIVFESADLEKAVSGAMASKFRNCGQTCVSANRFLVHEKLVKEFIDRLSLKIEALKCGNGADPGVTIGPLINDAQISKVEGIVKDAVEKGARVLLGGKRLSHLGNLFYAPTLLCGVKADMMCYQEEIFGPVVQVIPFNTEDEALRIANDTNSGLAGYFFSEDIQQIWRVGRRMNVGMVGVNEGMISCAEAAFGGIKESGFGREGSHYGIDEFSYVKYICIGGL